MTGKYDVIIIGAGASGMMCAITAGKRGRSVLVLEHTEKAGKKIRVSGGGRCNFTNINIDQENYLSSNRNFCRSALARFKPQDFIALLERHGIWYFEKEKGQLFCEKSSSAIIQMLHEEYRDAGAEILYHCSIHDISKGDHFTVSANQGIFQADSLVIATGGMSWPELGATDLGYRIARQFGLQITPLKPGLVPFIFTTAALKLFRELSGVSLEVEVSCNKQNFRGEILFTHRGLSGPAILQISSYWRQGDTISIDLLPGIDAYELLLAKRDSRVEIYNLLSAYWPKRFSHAWCHAHLQVKPMNQYSEKEMKQIAHNLHNWQLIPDSTEGYKKAEVTVGGVDTRELSSKTMEAQKLPGLFFIGEVVDVTGHLGGYNLHWAWASGFAAGQYV